jgi:hypothetical protein
MTFELPFDTFGSKLRELLTSTANKLDREWPDHRAQSRYSQTMLLSLVLAATNSYDSILYLCADKPADPMRKPEFALTVTPLSRVILEVLFTVVFTLEDLEGRSTWFHKAGWREMKEELKRMTDHRRTDPRWADYMAGLERVAATLRDELEISADDEATTLRNTKRWPLPSQMKNQPLSSDRKEFLEYLEDWFYRALSQDVHLSFRGLARSSRYLLLKTRRRNDPEEMRRHKSDVLGITITLLLALMSEIEIDFRFGLADRLRFVWGLVNPVFTQGEEIFEQRYAARLSTG